MNGRFTTDPCNWDVVAATVINANDTDANAVTFDSGQDSNSVLRGFTVTGGENGVCCDNSSSPVVRNCIITENDSAGVSCVSGSPLLTNNKIGENGGDGIYSASTTPPTVKNSLIYKNDKGMAFASATAVVMVRNNTVVDNTHNGISVASGNEPNISNCILWGHDTNDLVSCSATYSCIEDVNDANGQGNITSDPMFVHTENDGYFLDSLSPCLDAGDPNQTYNNEKDLYGRDITAEDAPVGSLTMDTWYVKVSATGDGYGDSWADATTLRDALETKAAPGDEIWVAAGTYVPGADRLTDTFTLASEVTTLGGFRGAESTKDQRDWNLHQTILSGDIIGDDGDNFTYRSDNCLHVVIGAADANLDGFIIQGGYADGDGMGCYGGGMLNDMCIQTVANCTFRDNHAEGDGGGLNNCGALSDGTVRNCVFEGNRALWFGGGLMNFYCTANIDGCFFINNTALDGGGVFNYAWGFPIITNCVFSGNEATQANGGGGGIFDGWVADPTVINCTFNDNTAAYGKAVLSYQAYGTYRNCIMWGDTTGQFYNHQGYPDVKYCDIKGDYGDPGDENMDEDPDFVNAGDPIGPDHIFGTADDGLALVYWGLTQDDNSPCINAGSTCSEDTDIIGNKRTMGGKVDMGAYEAMETFAHWKFDGDAKDSSCNGYDGTLYGPPTLESSDGIFGDTYTFDGSDYMKTDSGFPHIASAITVSSWITVDNFDTSYQTIINKASAWRLRRNGTNNTLQFVCDGLSPTSVGGTVPVDDGLWHHVTGVYDGANLYLYVDGVLDNSVTASGSLASNTNFVYVGGENATTRRWKGMIDDVRVYDYALEAAYEQAAKLFGEASYWRFVATGDSRDDDRESRRDPDDGTYDGVNNNRCAEMANCVIAERAELVLVPGDLIDGGFLDLETQLELWKSIMQPVYDAGITVMPVRGNHEIAGSTPGDDWKAVFPEIPENGPTGEKGYTYYNVHRNALFVGIDVYDGDNDTRGYNKVDSANRTWLEGVLSSDTSKHVFVLTHEPAFNLQHDDCLDEEESDRNAFWQILEDESGCRLYFCGHDHFYDHARVEYSDPDVHQMVVGTAGAPNRDWDDAGWSDTDPYVQHGDQTGPWTPRRIAYEGKASDNCYGYVVVEIWGASNVKTHWKHRKSDKPYELGDATYYEPGGDVFDYSVP
ncbi:MAG: LamG-like jellyroll fold domain-containing protein [Planctomycetota bacterium]|jgi:parallel beta-helix repeat protein